MRGGAARGRPPPIGRPPPRAPPAGAAACCGAAAAAAAARPVRPPHARLRPRALSARRRTLHSTLPTHAATSSASASPTVSGTGQGAGHPLGTGGRPARRAAPSSRAFARARPQFQPAPPARPVRRFFFSPSARWPRHQPYHLPHPHHGHRRGRRCDRGGWRLRPGLARAARRSLDARVRAGRNSLARAQRRAARGCGPGPAPRAPRPHLPPTPRPGARSWASRALRT
jgi:hypothetical protein